MELRTENRREEIVKRLLESTEPISAKVFAIDYHVSRQVIVQDMAIIRASRKDIISTNRGYLISAPEIHTREFKVMHSEDRVGEELMLIVDLGGRVKNVSISHRIYGRITAKLSINSRQDVYHFLEKLGNSSSKLLGNATMGYHYHEIEADREEILDMIHDRLMEAGFLAPLLDWELDAKDKGEV